MTPNTHASLPEDILTHLPSIISPPHNITQDSLHFIITLKNNLIQSNKLLTKIHNKSKLRKEKDKKVPPGSNEVQRSLFDKRYILCLLCINIAKSYELIYSDTDTVISSLREALIWFPKSIEAGLLLGQFLKPIVANEEQLLDVENIWWKAVSATQSLAPVDTIAEDGEVKCVDVNRLAGQLYQREKIASEKATELLILHYCQNDKYDMALPLLIRGRFIYKLSQHVLCYPLSTTTPQDCNGPVDTVSECSYAMGADNVLPVYMLRALQHIFRPTSPFWSEHSYDFYSNASLQVGYFSYLYPLRTQPTPCNAIEQVIDRIFDIVKIKFPSVARDTNIAEWWVHSRPHSCGHQFHYDSDETALYAGRQAQHPLISCILYLTERYEVDGEECVVGGPTVVTNQTLQSEGLATEGFMFLPRENRLVSFDAKHLHGVVPGRGVCSAPPRSRRVTFMVGFWKRIQSVFLPEGCAGPGQPFPGTYREYFKGIHEGYQGSTSPESYNVNSESQQQKYTWHQEMGLLQSPDSEVDATGCSPVSPIAIPNIWEPVVANSSDEPSTMIKAHYKSCFQGF